MHQRRRKETIYPEITRDSAKRGYGRTRHRLTEGAEVKDKTRLARKRLKDQIPENQGVEEEEEEGEQEEQEERGTNGGRRTGVAGWG